MRTFLIALRLWVPSLQAQQDLLPFVTLYLILVAVFRKKLFRIWKLYIMKTLNSNWLSPIWLFFIVHVLIFAIRILFPVEILPSPPEAVFTESSSETSLIISWSKPLRKMETLTHYVVHISALSNFDKLETTEGPDNKTYFLPDVKVC